MFTYKGLRNILQERGISFRQLARDTGLTSNVTVDLNNDNPVRIDRLAVICHYLDVPIEAVVEIIRNQDA